MHSATVTRLILPDGSVQLSDAHCTFHYRRLKPGAILVTITGEDVGQFGSASVDEIAAEFTRFERPVTLFIDLRQAKGPATVVMETWTAWLAAQQKNLQRVVLLVPPNRRSSITISIAQHLSRTGNLLRICGELTEFERRLAEAAPDFKLGV